ncbi:S1 RNA-binding domain-containing protein [Acutalibacter caecimuris]|uniref:S1 RNA-binding domain-containing protein n=1 Tax=Acutalibacter caecimuris TaxID=3093657 RepID=UPI002AC98072|nr:S1 RNA-binding domain-containing protein [Acutalibacter sp. M00118]
MGLAVGEIYEGKVTGITKFGAFVSLEGGKTGMVHISEVAPTFVNEIKDFVTEGQTVKVKVLSISEEGKISLSMKKALPPEEQHRPRRQNQGQGQARRPGPRPPRAPRPEPAVSPGRPGDFEWQGRRNDSGSFEDMMSRFKQTSDEKMSDLKRGNETRRGYSRRGPKG